MSKEIPLQVDMFGEALVDTRSRTQKSRDKASQQPQQISMFTARETVQHGVNPRPWLKDLPAPTMNLEIIDVRTEEEKERERRQLAESLTTPMFGGSEVTRGLEQIEDIPTEVKPTPAPQTVDETVCLRQVGFRAYARRKSISVRRSGGNVFRSAE
jgi:hypothetical protein